jgi:hypothetical protein
MGARKVVTHVYPVKIYNRGRMWLLDLLSGKNKDTRAPAMTHPAEGLVSDGSGNIPANDGEEKENDPFHGHTTLTYKEDGTDWVSNQKFVDANVAANLLNVRTDYRVYLNTPVEMKYYGDVAPDVKLYLLRNRVLLKENSGLWNHFNIREKGPVVVHNITKKPNPILPPPAPDRDLEQPLYKPRGIKITAHQSCSASPPIPRTFRGETSL